MSSWQNCCESDWRDITELKANGARRWLVPGLVAQPPTLLASRATSGVSLSGRFGGKLGLLRAWLHQRGSNDKR